MKNLILPGLLFAIILTANAQENYSFKYGRITDYEANMKTYPSDEDAEAVVILRKNRKGGPNQYRNIYTGIPCFVFNIIYFDLYALVDHEI